MGGEDALELILPEKDLQKVGGKILMIEGIEFIKKEELDPVEAGILPVVEKTQAGRAGRTDVKERHGHFPFPDTDRDTQGRFQGNKIIRNAAIVKKRHEIAEKIVSEDVFVDIVAIRQFAHELIEPERTEPEHFIREIDDRLDGIILFEGEAVVANELEGADVFRPIGQIDAFDVSKIIAICASFVIVIKDRSVTDEDFFAEQPAVGILLVDVSDDVAAEGEFIGEGRNGLAAFKIDRELIMNIRAGVVRQMRGDVHHGEAEVGLAGVVIAEDDHLVEKTVFDEIAVEVIIADRGEVKDDFVLEVLEILDTEFSDHRLLPHLHYNGMQIFYNSKVK